MSPVKRIEDMREDYEEEKISLFEKVLIGVLILGLIIVILISLFKYTDTSALTQALQWLS